MARTTTGRQLARGASQGRFWSDRAISVSMVAPRRERERVSPQGTDRLGPCQTAYTGAVEPRGHATASALGGAVASGQSSRRRRRRSRIRLAFYLLLIGVASLITYLVLFFFNALPTMKLQGPRRVNALPASPVLAEAAGARAPRATVIDRRSDPRV